MSFENFPSGTTSPGQKPPQQKKDFKSIIIAVLAVALIAMAGYLIWDKNQDKDKEQTLTAQVNTSDSAKAELQKELNDAGTQIDALKTQNSKADSLIRTKDKDIESIKARVQSILKDKNATAAQLSEARRLINTLKTNIASYQAEIETLKGENVKLTQEKEEVTQQRDVANKNFDSTKNVVKEKEGIIDIGSTLHASNFEVLGVKEKSNGKEKETTTAKRVDKLKISFDIDENRITTTGQKEVYISIIGPDGKPVTVEALGSGKFTTRDGIERPFTKKVLVNYKQGEKQSVNVEWKQNSEFQTGDYKIEVYNNGFKIGEGVRSFKKGGLFG
jgi:FtsZ-binding cell division protein ZapB